MRHGIRDGTTTTTGKIEKMDKSSAGNKRPGILVIGINIGIACI